MFRRGVVPAARRVVVVRPGVNHAIVNDVMRQMRIIRIAIERELKHAHARQLKLIAERRHRRRDQPQVLGQ